MTDTVAAVARTIRRERLINTGDRVAAAVSGGSDSVALAWLLRELAPDRGATLAGLIHVNHGLRGKESDTDEQFCRALAARLQMPIEVHHQNVAELARTRRVSLEAAARLARYESFERAASSLQANLVATGHTEDDQAETVLLRLLRGAGTRGLSGIRVRRGLFIRPLLNARRDELRRYLRARGEEWREDASNANPAFLRNRIRHELVPVLKHLAPGGVRALARLARLASDDEAFLEAAANDNARSLVLSDNDSGSRFRDSIPAKDSGNRFPESTPGVVVDGAGLARLPRALARRLVRQFAAKAVPDVNLSARHLEAVCLLAGTDKPSGWLDLPGLTVAKSGDRLEFRAGTGSRQGRRGQDSSPAWPSRPLPVPGVVVVPEAGIAIEARAARPDETRGPSHGTRVVVQSRAVAMPLQVRNRHDGDRFQPLGAPGHRKLQDVLVDRKVPRAERDTVPIVTDANGEIVWVAGVTLAERCRVQSPGDDMLILELRKHK